MSDARWDDPRGDDARDRGDDPPRVYDPRDPMKTIPVTG